MTIRNRQSMYREQGFTIIELMIALSVLSVILVTSSVIMIRIGAMYNKGVNSAALQNTNRTIISDVSKSLQFSGSAPLKCDTAIAGVPKPACFHGVGDSTEGDAYKIYRYCVGTTRYSFVLDRAMGKDLYPTEKFTPHVLWRDTLLNTAGCPWLDISKSNVADLADPTNAVPGSGYDMVPGKMRIGRFEVLEVGPPTNKTYQMNVLMAYGDSDLIAPSPNDTGQPYACKGGPTSQYCAISRMTNQVARRVK